MSEHESVRQLLALSAAGLLDSGEERLVREHARQCARCAAQGRTARSAGAAHRTARAHARRGRSPGKIQSSDRLLLSR